MARQRKAIASELAAAQPPSSPDSQELVPGAEQPKPQPMALMPQANTAAALPAHSAAAGMVRIGKGSQQRCIWPVHLSGWQQLGWQLVGHGEPQSEPSSTTRTAAATEQATERWDLPETGVTSDIVQASEAIGAIEQLPPTAPTTGESSDD